MGNGKGSVCDAVLHCHFAGSKRFHFNHFLLNEKFVAAGPKAKGLQGLLGKTYYT